MNKIVCSRGAHSPARGHLAMPGGDTHEELSRAEGPRPGDEQEGPLSEARTPGRELAVGEGGAQAPRPRGRAWLASDGRTARAPWLSRPRRALSTQKRSGRKRHCSTEAEERMLVWETNRPGSSCGLRGTRWERPAQGRVKEAPCRPVARACGPIGGEASEEDGTRNRDAAAGTSNGQN